MDNEVTETHYSIAEVAELVGKTIRTLAWWRMQNIGPPYRKLGISIWYPKKDFKKWFKEQVHVHGEPNGR